VQRRKDAEEQKLGIAKLGPVLLASLRPCTLAIIPVAQTKRAFPKLERIGFQDDPKSGCRPDQTAAEFWKDYDANKPAPK